MSEINYIWIILYIIKKADACNIHRHDKAYTKTRADRETDERLPGKVVHNALFSKS
jgi:hypothetical protein